MMHNTGQRCNPHAQVAAMQRLLSPAAAHAAISAIYRQAHGWPAGITEGDIHQGGSYSKEAGTEGREGLTGARMPGARRGPPRECMSTLQPARGKWGPPKQERRGEHSKARSPNGDR